MTRPLPHPSLRRRRRHVAAAALALAGLAVGATSPSVGAEPRQVNDQTTDGALREVKTDIVDCGKTIESLGDVLNAEQTIGADRFAHAAPPSRSSRSWF